MADRKVTVWNNDGYQEILRTRVDDDDPGDRLVVDGGGGTKFDTNVGFFQTDPIAQQEGTDLAPAALLKALADALNAFGLTDITFDSNIDTELDELQSLLDNPVNITGTAPISATAGSSAPDLNNWTIAIANASTGQLGAIQIATLTEIITGTDNTKAVSPDGLSRALNEKGAVIGDDTDRTDDGYTIDCGVYYTDP